MEAVISLKNVQMRRRTTYDKLQAPSFPVKEKSFLNYDTDCSKQHIPDNLLKLYRAFVTKLILTHLPATLIESRIIC